MKKQILFLTAMLVAVSCMPVLAVEAKRTLTGRSSWALVKGAAKIIIGAPMAIGGIRGLIVSVPTFGLGVIAAIASKGNPDSVAIALVGGVLTVISAGFTAGGGWLAYSGVKDINDEEEPEVKQQEAVKAK